MPRLHIALHDGFRGDRVVIAVDRRVVFDQTGVTTDLRISRADALDVDTAGRRATVQVTVLPGTLGGRSVQDSEEVDVAATPFLAVDRRADDTLLFRPAREAFVYM